jgi:hypothetical protein
MDRFNDSLDQLAQSLKTIAEIYEAFKEASEEEGDSPGGQGPTTPTGTLPNVP